MTNDTAQVPARKRYLSYERTGPSRYSIGHRGRASGRGGGTCGSKTPSSVRPTYSTTIPECSPALIWEITDVTTTTRRASANRETTPGVCETYSRKFAEAATLPADCFVADCRHLLSRSVSPHVDLRRRGLRYAGGGAPGCARCCSICSTSDWSVAHGCQRCSCRLPGTAMAEAVVDERLKDLF